MNWRTSTVWNNACGNHFACNCLFNSTETFLWHFIFFPFTVNQHILITNHFRLQQTHNTEVDKSPKLTILRPAKIQLEDLLLPKFVKNASICEYGGKIDHDRRAYKRAQEKFGKIHQRSNERVNKPKLIRNMNDIKKEYTNGNKRVNGNHVR